MLANAFGPVPPFEMAHAHTVSCYWDYREARWNCGARQEAAVVDATATEVANSEPGTAVRPAGGQP